MWSRKEKERWKGGKWFPTFFKMATAFDVLEMAPALSSMMSGTSGT